MDAAGRWFIDGLEPRVGSVGIWPGELVPDSNVGVVLDEGIDERSIDLVREP